MHADSNYTHKQILFHADIYAYIYSIPEHTQTHTIAKYFFISNYKMVKKYSSFYILKIFGQKSLCECKIWVRWFYSMSTIITLFTTEISLFCMQLYGFKLQIIICKQL